MLNASQLDQRYEPAGFATRDDIALPVLPAKNAGFRRLVEGAAATSGWADLAGRAGLAAAPLRATGLGSFISLPAGAVPAASGPSAAPGAARPARPFADAALTTPRGPAAPAVLASLTSPAAPLRPAPFGGAAAAAKRAFDVAAASVLLVLLVPVLLPLVLALQLDSPGPVFFVQRRVGRNGRLFGCIKLRTMRRDAEAVLAAVLAACPRARREWEADHKLRNDPRVSRLGRLARKLSLDELPQLINVLRGEMSIVGPRPIVQAEIPRYGAFFADYCAVKPGLTGLWQVSGRNDVSYGQRVQFDRHYARRASLLLDLRILLRTVPAVLFAQGSY